MYEEFRYDRFMRALSLRAICVIVAVLIGLALLICADVGLELWIVASLLLFGICLYFGNKENNALVRFGAVRLYDDRLEIYEHGLSPAHVIPLNSLQSMSGQMYGDAQSYRQEPEIYLLKASGKPYTIRAYPNDRLIDVLEGWVYVNRKENPPTVGSKTRG